MSQCCQLLDLPRRLRQRAGGLVQDVLQSDLAGRARQRAAALNAAPCWDAGSCGSPAQRADGGVSGLKGGIHTRAALAGVCARARARGDPIFGDWHACLPAARARGRPSAPRAGVIAGTVGTDACTAAGARRERARVVTLKDWGAAFVVHVRISGRSPRAPGMWWRNAGGSGAGGRRKRFDASSEREGRAFPQELYDCKKYIPPQRRSDWAPQLGRHGCGCG
jgi:hypothetical protein